MKRFLLIALSVLSIGAGTLAVSAPQIVHADAKDDICAGIGAATGGNCTNEDNRITTTIKNIVNLLSVIVGIVAVIMIVIAGFKYITSAGDSSSIASAKNTLIYAIVGLVIVAMSQFIVQFVLRKAAPGAGMMLIDPDHISRAIENAAPQWYK